MIRSSILATTALAICLTACNTASDDAKKAQAARAEADDKSGAAVDESAEKVKSARAEADQKIAAARADFATLREDYRHATTKNLVDLDHAVDDLTAKANQASGKEKTDRDAGLKQIHASREAFWKDYQSLDGALESTWDAAKSRVDKEWTDLKALVDRA
jgi:hypothetical protein